VNRGHLRAAVKRTGAEAASGEGDNEARSGSGGEGVKPRVKTSASGEGDSETRSGSGDKVVKRSDKTSTSGCDGGESDSKACGGYGSGSYREASGRQGKGFGWILKCQAASSGGKTGGSGQTGSEDRGPGTRTGRETASWETGQDSGSSHRETYGGCQ